MKNSFKYFNTFVEKIHDKSPTPSKSPLKIVNGGLDSKTSTLANTLSLEERIKAGSFQTKMMNQLGIKDTNHNHIGSNSKNSQETARNGGSYTERYEEIFKLKKELSDSKEKEKKYMGKIFDLEKENVRLLELIRMNERDFNERILQRQSEKQEILKKYNELRSNYEQNATKNERLAFTEEKKEENEMLLARIVNELNFKMLEIEKNAMFIIKEKRIGKENIVGEENLIKSNENFVRKCKEMEFVIFHLHNENKHLKQYVYSYSDPRKETKENGENLENGNLPLPSTLKILELVKKGKR